MDRTVYITAISCLVIGALAGHMVTRIYPPEQIQGGTNRIHEAAPQADKPVTGSAGPSSTRENVTGIGGFFFRGKKSSKLDDWYEKHLGVTKPGKEYDDGSWWQDEGPTVFGSEEDDVQVGGKDHSWRINFRVRNLDAMVAQLRAAGLSVEVDAEKYPNGRFAHLRDPEGNSIELWEAAGADLVRPRDR